MMVLYLENKLRTEYFEFDAVCTPRNIFELHSFIKSYYKLMYDNSNIKFSVSYQHEVEMDNNLSEAMNNRVIAYVWDYIETLKGTDRAVLLHDDELDIGDMIKDVLKHTFYINMEFTNENRLTIIASRAKREKYEGGILS